MTNCESEKLANIETDLLELLDKYKYYVTHDEIPKSEIIELLTELHVEVRQLADEE